MPDFVASDGTTVFVSNFGSNTVSRIVASDGEILPDYTGVPSPLGLLIFNTSMYVASSQAPGKVYTGSAHTAAANPMSTSSPLGDHPVSLTTDGRNLWTADFGPFAGTGSVSKIDLKTGPITYTSITYTTGFNRPQGILFDGSNLWVTDNGDASLKRVSTVNGTVLQTIPLSGGVNFMVFDGANLWIPCQGPDQVYVVRAVGGLQGTILAQLTGNGISQPTQAAFDGERILVTNYSSPTNTVSLWNATDLSPIGAFDIGGSNGLMNGACNDGISFWVTLSGALSFGGSGLVLKF